MRNNRFFVISHDQIISGTWRLQEADPEGRLGTDRLV